MNFFIRDAGDTDLESVLDLNESVVPHVNSLDIDQMRDFFAKAVYFRIGCDETGRLLAFLIGLNPDIEYKSRYYRWFCTHYRDFAHVDRIAVVKDARRIGIAAALYRDFDKESRNWAQRMCCEVNLQPANPASMAFHQRLGFRQVGTQQSDDGIQQVAMMVREYERR